jgi:hypothetical protein
VFDEGTLKTSGVTGFNFTGAGVIVTNSGDYATVDIPGATGGGGGGTIYALKADMGRLAENAAGKQTDVSRVVQITTSPFSSNTVTVGTIPSTSDDNKISFSFGSESVPPSAIHVYAYNANSNFYVWTQIDTSSASLNTINQVTGTTQSTTSSPGGNFYSSTDLVTGFDSLTYSIELDSGRLGAANGASGFSVIYGHYFIFFTFPA